MSYPTVLVAALALWGQVWSLGAEVWAFTIGIQERQEQARNMNK